ncbi:hypothetical protein [Paraburkholderia sp. J8-2]|uniref:hypothetical protein n=1 Tax=Paraburkholderia sp. J8-2 TaxID=2805440 RepID=UPI002AB5E34A|nr:hypothetical protein [Paraburkholderia sp. J8-2]
METLLLARTRQLRPAEAMLAYDDRLLDTGAVTRGPPAMDGKGVEMSHELYIQALSAMFLFWNGARILTYLPTIGKLLAREADMRSHSLLSWGCWAFSNGTFALMLLEMSRGIPNGMFWMNLANTLMCVIVSLIILFRRFPRLHTGASKVYRNIRQNEWKPDAVAGQLGLLHLGGRSLAGGANLAVDPVPTTPPMRLGRLALWVAPASVVAFGAAGAVTYDLWSDHVQNAGIESNASARQAFGIISPASPIPQGSSSAQVSPATAVPARATAIARAELAPPTPSTSPGRSAAPSRDGAAPRMATGRVGKAGNVAAQNRGHWASRLMTSLRQALGIPRSTSPKRQTLASGHGAPPRSASARGTAVGRAEIVRRVPSPPFNHGAAQRRDFPAPRVATGWPGTADDFATQNRRRSVQQVPVDEARPGDVVEAAPVVYAAPPGVYVGPPVVYAQAPVAYGRGYGGEYWDHRQWHDNGRHKGWKHRQHDDAEDD